MESSLNLEENWFLEQYGEVHVQGALMTARFNYYHPCSMPNRILRVKPQVDASAITILLQDKQVEGLQFFKGNHWFKSRIEESSFDGKTLSKLMKYSEAHHLMVVNN